MIENKVIKQPICVIPNCGRDGLVVREKEKIYLCRIHLDSFYFLMWALDNVILTKEKKTDSGLILPS